LTTVIVIDAFYYVYVRLGLHNHELIPINDVVLFYCRHNCDGALKNCPRISLLDNL